MDRREALKSLAGIVSATGMSVAPVTARDAERCELVVLRVNGHASDNMVARLREYWKHAVDGTALQDVKTVVLDGSVDVEFVRK